MSASLSAAQLDLGEYRSPPRASTRTWHELEPIQGLVGVCIALRVCSDSAEDADIVVDHPSVPALRALGATVDGLAKTTGFTAALPIMAIMISQAEPRLRLSHLVHSIASTLYKERWERSAEMAKAMAEGASP